MCAVVWPTANEEVELESETDQSEQGGNGYFIASCMYMPTLCIASVSGHRLKQLSSS